MPITEEAGVRAVVQGAAQYVSDAARVNAATGQMVAGVGHAERAAAAAAGSLGTVGRASRQAGTDIGSVAGAAERSGQSLQQMGSRMRELGAQGIFLGAALSSPAAAALVLAVNFETAMTRISTLSGIAAGDVGELRDGLLEISKISAQGPDELAKGLLTITSTGKEGAEALNILEASAKSSAIGLGETNEIARTLTAAVTAFQSQGLTAAHAADVLFATVREGGAEVADVAGSLGRVVGIAAQVGVSFEDVGAFIATFTRLGVGADEAVTALRGTLTTLINPSDQAAEALQKAGLSMEGLRQTAREKGLNEALRLIIEAFRGNEEALSDVIPNVRALAGVLGTAGSQAEEFAGVLDALRNSEGDLDRAFETTSRTNAFKFQQAIADIKREAIEAGAVLLPALSKVLDILTKVVDAFGKVPAPVLAVGLAMTGLAGIAIGLVSSFAVLLGAALSLAGPLGLAGISAAAAGAGAGLIGAEGAAVAAAGGFAGLGAAATGAGAAIGALAIAAAPVIALGAAVAGGIFAAAFIADKLAAQEAADAVSELNRVKGLADRAATAPEETAPAPRRASADAIRRGVAITAAGALGPGGRQLAEAALGETHEERLIKLVERRKQLEKDIAAIKAGKSVETGGVPRTARGLSVELADVNNQIAGRSPAKGPSNLGVATEELASLRQLRSELEGEANAFEAAGKNVSAHRLEIAKLDVQIRELSSGVRTGAEAIAKSAGDDVTKTRAEQTQQTQLLTAAQEELNKQLGLPVPLKELDDLRKVEADSTATTEQLAEAHRQLNQSIGLTEPGAAFADLIRLEQSGVATADQLSAAHIALSSAVEQSGSPEAKAALSELFAVEQSGVATSGELAAAHDKLGKALGVTPRAQALSDYIALLRSGTAAPAELQGAIENLNHALGGRATAAINQYLRVQRDLGATTKELADSEAKLKDALAGAAQATEEAIGATSAALERYFALLQSGSATAADFAAAQQGLETALGLTEPAQALLRYNALLASGVDDANALKAAHDDLNAAVADSGNPAAIKALDELISLEKTGTATDEALTAAHLKLMAALRITPAVEAFLAYTAALADSTAGTREQREALDALAATLSGPGLSALGAYRDLLNNTSATEEDRKAALDALAAALVTSTQGDIAAAAAAKATAAAYADSAAAQRLVTDTARALADAKQEEIDAGLHLQDVLADENSSAEAVAEANRRFEAAVNAVRVASGNAEGAIHGLSGATDANAEAAKNAAAANRELADAIARVRGEQSKRVDKFEDTSGTAAAAGERGADTGQRGTATRPLTAKEVEDAFLAAQRAVEATSPATAERQAADARLRKAEFDLQLLKNLRGGQIDPRTGQPKFRTDESGNRIPFAPVTDQTFVPGTTTTVGPVGDPLGDLEQTTKDALAKTADDVKAAEAALADARKATSDATSAASKSEREAEQAQREAEAADREREQAFRESIAGRTLEAIQNVRQQRIQEQAEAIAREAFGLDGPSLSDVLATQQRSTDAFAQMRQKLLELGVEIPEDMLALFDRAAAAAETGAKKAGLRMDDLLTFFIARQIGRGTPFQNLVSVPPQVQAQLATSPAATGQGGTVQQVNLNGPINIGAGVTTGDVAHGVALAVRPAMSSL